MSMLHENSSPQALGIARIGLYSIWLAELIRNPPMPLAQFPVDWFQPTGI
jgi:hypothetical protein